MSSLIALDGYAPVVAPNAFIAPGARLIGDVEIGEQASVWYNCVLRGDVNAIRIGARTNIQDGTVIHADGPRDFAGAKPTIIGTDCLVGHMAMLHGVELQDHAFVGLCTVVMDGCVIEGDGMLGAGSLLPPGKVVRRGELWLGRPAKFVRLLSEEEIARNRLSVPHYVMNAERHAAAVAAGQP